jgi:hypothetical protein
MIPVPEELLRKLAAMRPKPERTASSNGSWFDIQGFFARHRIEVRGPYQWQDGQKWVLPICPWNSSHNNGAAYVVQFSNGALAAGCHHESCKGRGWRELREKYEPEAYARQGEGGRDRRRDDGDRDASTDWDDPVEFPGDA